MELPKKIAVLGVGVSLVTPQTITDFLKEILKNKKPIQIVTPNPEQLIQAEKNENFRNVLNEAEIAIPDGIGVICALRVKTWKLGISFPKLKRLSGVDLAVLLCRLCQEQGLNLGLLGSSKNVRVLTISKLKQHFPKLLVVNLPSHSDITQENERENKTVLRAINQAKINVLLVAYGAPFQEIWIKKNLPSLPSVTIAMGVGGAFDFLSGEIKRAPIWIQQLGLEWLYRLIQQPWRWKRQLRLFEFSWRVLFNDN